MASSPVAPVVDNPDSLPTARIARLARRLRHHFDVLLDPYGLTGVQFGLLNRLDRADGLVQADLGRRMAIEPATLTGIVQRLEREGWLHRTCDPDNRRLQRVWLTDKAREAMPALRQLQAHYHREVLAGLTDKDVTRLCDILEQIEENLR